MDKIKAYRIEGVVYITLEDHKADVARYKKRIQELEQKSVKPRSALEELFGGIEGLGRKR